MNYLTEDEMVEDMALADHLDESFDDICDHDGRGEPTRLPVKVCQSAAGFYIGTFCDTCGPYDRHSADYWRKREDAQAALDSGAFVPKF